MASREVYDPEDDVWLPTDYDGYFVSNSGRVWGPGKHGRGKLMKQNPGNKYGHLEVSVRVNGKRVHKYVHRLVAEAFIPNPHNYPIVRHLNGDPSDNRVENLMWGTQTDNMRDAINDGTFVFFTDEDRELAMRKRRTPIKAIKLKNGEETFFESQQEASRRLGVDQPSINGVLNGQRHSAKGYFFVFIDDDREINISSIKQIKYKAPLKATNIETREELLFKSQTEAARVLDMSIASISNVLRGKQRQAKGYIFEYIDEEDFNRA